ncbi:hypothetical protein GCM10022197_19770 [Microlunatus spumicola]|uniref:Uncharacterized protein n=1 Tax=Microlunatus spumicola TaxID=81499 RepID=A0ABP6XGE2_9ACTN
MVRLRSWTACVPPANVLLTDSNSITLNPTDPVDPHPDVWCPTLTGVADISDGSDRRARTSDVAPAYVIRRRASYP